MTNRSRGVTTFKESNLGAVASYSEGDNVNFSEDDILGEFFENPAIGAALESSESESWGLETTVGDALEPFMEGDGSLGDVAEELGEVDEDITKFVEEHGDVKLGDLIPGTHSTADELEDGEPEPEKNYADDGDLSKFMEYVGEQYPSKIPQHDGRSMVGCERATSFLDKLNSEISRAIREDTDDVLDLEVLEGVRVGIMKDILVLKDHFGKLKKLVKDEHSKKASVGGDGVPKWTNGSGREVGYGELTKEAGTPNNIVIAVSPFERAISGIMINAHVSGGHPIEDVYGFLSDKYGINDREELAIMQLCMDSGFHIFKDRGTFSSDCGDNDETGVKRGADFMRNYFA